MTVLAELEPVGVRPATTRTLFGVLVMAQVLAGLGQSGATAGALLARDLTGRDAAASLPLALVVLGASGLVLPIAALSRRSGRRLGLTTALTGGGLGAAMTVAAGALHSFPLLMFGSVVFGAGNAAVMLARYAAADLSSPSHRGRAISLVVVATTVGAVAGPNLLSPAGNLAGVLGLPPLTGLYLLSAMAYFAAGGVLFALLRPDPLHLASISEADLLEASGPPPSSRLLGSSAARTGLACMVIANFAMVAVMAMAPVHLHQHGHGLAFVGFLVSLHVVGMFAPAPVTGWLTDRLRPVAVATGGTQLLILAAALVALGSDSLAVGLGLFLLGVGWNVNLISGSTLLAAGVPIARRPRAEGIGELSMGVVAIGGTAFAGPLVSVTSYATLAGLTAVVAAAAVPLLLVAARHGTVAAPPATRILG